MWKVHGSFDWFKDPSGAVKAIPITGQRPEHLEPVIVTPGIEKFRLTHDEPFLSIKQGADSSMASAGSFLCIGYGFNDPHIQTSLVERCRIENTPVVLITKQISTAAKSFFNGSNCRCYLAIEENEGGCRMFTKEYPNGEVIVGEPFWQLQTFISMVTT